ncbi:serine/threonine protein kinase [Nocardioides pocheonensis]|uniref:Protein kinase domain-containing protein n=1 Tax=Nocardioides pocheonensis TaxID=661485 RepID=A0A3N0GUZ2_9ACTN|nr:protein kinase [Nocardioides pocheonensis]RNM16239.1 hypothetical protein EFL26_05625 [Nocardioides pocheonensis]
MDTSAFWVGPADEPGRYRLTHLLGSGGEGEVWRAVRAGDEEREVAVKIDTLPSDGTDDWAKRLDALGSLVVPGLVRVEETFVGVARHRADDDTSAAPTHRYVVMNHVPGLTLRTWLDEHPDAAPRERIRILRGVAATLSRLHRGNGGPGPITHGDVKPTNIIIGTDGAPVLVDLGLLRPAGSGPASGRTAAYSSPELRNPDGRPGPRADTFSFAVTAMETLTGLTPPLSIDGSLDLDATRARVATAPALRARPVLRRQLLRSLAPEPEGRPGTPVRVFAGRTAVLVLVPILLVIGAGGSAIAMRTAGEHAAGPAAATGPRTPTTSKRIIVDPPTTGSPSPTAPTSAPPTGTVAKPSPASPSPSATTSNPAVVHVVDHGQILNGRLTGGTNLDTQVDCNEPQGPVTADLSPLQPTSWGGGKFQLVLTAKQDLHVLAVTRIPTRAPAPTRVFQKLGLTCPVGTVVSPPEPAHVCPPPTQQFTTFARYRADADNGGWQQVIGNDHRPFGVLDGRCRPPSVVDLVADDCRTNVDYQVRVRYEVVGKPGTIYERTFPPIHLRARVTHGHFVAAVENLPDYAFPFSGGPDGCRDHGVSVTRPYATPTDGIYTVLVDRIAQIRQDHPSMTTTQAIDALIVALEQGGTRRVPSPFTAADLLNVCHQAQADPARWRGTCGPPDSSG